MFVLSHILLIKDVKEIEFMKNQKKIKEKKKKRWDIYALTCCFCFFFSSKLKLVHRHILMTKKNDLKYAYFSLLACGNGYSDKLIILIWVYYGDIWVRLRFVSKLKAVMLQLWWGDIFTCNLFHYLNCICFNSVLYLWCVTSNKWSENTLQM